jgi:TetR/AcrR family tetracycline transcriptional repressor
MDRLLDSMSETDAGLFRSMYKNKLFELVGSDGSFEFGLKLILLGIEQVIKEQEK